MKKILLLLTLITFSAFAQNPDYHRYGARIKFVQPDTLSTSLRNALTPKLGTLIYHKDTGISQWEQWNGDSWEELGGDGAVSSVNSQTGDVLLNADDISDTSTTNKFVTSTEKGLIATALQSADLANYVTTNTFQTITSIKIFDTGTGFTNIVSNNNDYGDGIHSTNSGSGRGIVSNNTGIGAGIHSTNSGSGRGIVSQGMFSSTGNIFEGLNDTTTTFSVTKEGNVTANSFIKSGATSDDVLLGDGSTTSLAGIGGGGGSDDQTASEVPFTPYETIGATNVQDAIEELKDEVDVMESSIPAPPNLSYETLTYTASQTVSHDALRPNKVVTTTGNWSLTLNSVSSGVSGKLLIKSSDGNEIKLNGSTAIDFTSQGDDVLAFYEVDSTGDIHWRTADPVTKELTSDGDTTISFEADNYYLTLADVDDLISLGIPTHPKEITLTIQQGATTATDILFENNLMISGGVMPTLTQTTNAVDVWKIKYDNGKFYVTSITEDYSNVAGTAPLVLTPIIRVNLGGSAITATDGEIDWQSGTGTSGTSWGVSGGVTSTSAAGITWTRHASIPSSIPDADFQTVFDSSRYTSTNQTFTFTVANGDYEVQIFTGEQIGSGTGVTFDITIEGNLVEDDGYLPTIFGYQTAGMLSYPVTVSDGNITVLCTKISGSANFFIHGIQIVE